MQSARPVLPSSRGVMPGPIRTTPHGRLMLTVPGGLAEFERELILARTVAGRDRAKAKGVRFGRPPSLTPHQRREAMERLAQGAAQAELARCYGRSRRLGFTHWCYMSSYDAADPDAVTEGNGGGTADGIR